MKFEMRAEPGYKQFFIVIILLLIAFTAGTAFVAGWRQLHGVGMLARLHVFEGGDFSGSTRETAFAPRGSGCEIDEMRILLREAGFVPKENWPLQDMLVLQTWLGNQVTKVRSYRGSESGYRLIGLARRGTGMACGSMSLMLADAFTALGIPARTVQLYRTNFNRFDTHVIVEVRLHERWVAMDPTFNVTYELNDKTPLGVAEIQRHLTNSAGNGVIPVYPLGLCRPQSNKCKNTSKLAGSISIHCSRSPV